ncbi:hypothetical protein [Burkholderia sp. JP2-270]|uniref:hypothetical protein n=1 Tax=Burkholderia sp. JP2-270 TaxID=2217913 RepID=UPI0013A698D3|nr:hypothetical protein [Burkholderia sp. JP2-270]
MQLNVGGSKMIEPGTREWRACKRDSSIKRSRAEMVMPTADDIPRLNPFVVLLFKARDRYPEDQQDFDRALPKLPVGERVWLKRLSRHSPPLATNGRGCFNGHSSSFCVHSSTRL